MIERAANLIGRMAWGEPIRPKDWLNQGGTFTTSQLCELAKGIPDKDGGRKLLLVSEKTPVRLVPEEMYKTAKTYLSKTGNEEEVMRYLLAGYSFWSSCNTDNFVTMPLILKNGACEWLPPDEFSWSNLEDVIFMGEYGQRQSSGGVLIERVEGDEIVSEEYAVNTHGGLSPLKKSRVKIVPRLHKRNESIPFRVGRLADIRFIDVATYGDLWRKLGSFLFNLLDNYRKGEISPEQARNGLVETLQLLGETGEISLARYTKTGERPNLDSSYFSFSPFF